MKKVSTYLVLMGLLFLQPISSSAQQWFVRSFDFSTAINQKPDFRPGGTYVTTDVNEQATGVLVYGTIGYSDNELSGGDGGFGNADGVILYNDLDGNNIWGMTVGSNHDDVISRVVEDSDGNIAIAGYTVVSGQKTAFLIKVKTATLSFEWAYMFGEGVPTDMINVNAYGTLLSSDGFAVSGTKSNGKAFVFYVDVAGNLNWANRYAPTSGSLQFNSIIQPKIKDVTISSIPFYDNYLIVAGASGGSGYVARLNVGTGNIVNDFKASNHIPICNGTSIPKAYVSLDQWQSGDIVAFGYSGSSRSEIHLTALTDQSNFTIKWDRMFSGGQPSMHGFPLDINATAFGYLGVFEYSGGLINPFKIVEYDFDGNIVRWETLQNNTGFTTNWYFMKEKHQVSTPDLYPYVDFSMECGKAFHFTGTEANSVNPPANWSIDNIPHARLRLNTESCMEVPFTMTEEYCDNYFQEGEGPDAGKDASITPYIYTEEIGISSISPSSSTFCESTCPKSACVNPQIIIGGANQDFVILDGDFGSTDYIWSNGLTTRAISVSLKNEVNSYSVDQTDANGCVTTKLFFVAKGKRLNSKEEELNINEVSLYPNPTSGLLSIDIPVDGITVEIYDALGKLVKKTDSLNAGTHQIDISEQAQGLFSVRISGNGINKVIKLNKN